MFFAYSLIVNQQAVQLGDKKDIVSLSQDNYYLTHCSGHLHDCILASSGIVSSEKWQKVTNYFNSFDS